MNGRGFDGINKPVLLIRVNSRNATVGTMDSDFKSMAPIKSKHSVISVAMVLTRSTSCH